jgi:hypothetical protein
MKIFVSYSRSTAENIVESGSVGLVRISVLKVGSYNSVYHAKL